MIVSFIGGDSIGRMQLLLPLRRYLGESVHAAHTVKKLTTHYISEDLNLTLSDLIKNHKKNDILIIIADWPKDLFGKQQQYLSEHSDFVFECFRENEYPIICSHPPNIKITYRNDDVIGVSFEQNIMTDVVNDIWRFYNLQKE